MTRVTLRPNLLEELKSSSGIVDDDAFAATLRTDRAELDRLRRGGAPSIGFIAGVSKAFGLALSDVAVIVEDEPQAAAS